MGRLKKYQTEEEKQVIKKQRAREYYWNNKEQEDLEVQLRDLVAKKIEANFNNDSMRNMLLGYYINFSNAKNPIESQ